MKGNVDMKRTKADILISLGEQLKTIDADNDTALEVIIMKLIALSPKSTEIENGDRAKCIITGFEGIVICERDYLTGCNQIAIKPQTLKDGRPIDAQWLDIQQCKLVKKNAFELDNEETPGGPCEHPAGL